MIIGKNRLRRITLFAMAVLLPLLVAACSGFGRDDVVNKVAKSVVSEPLKESDEYEEKEAKPEKSEKTYIQQEIKERGEKENKADSADTDNK
ncbi:MAG: hypothetical protein ACOX1Q_03920 [Eubacteriales bacterium]|jgi:hypothetical protein